MQIFFQQQGNCTPNAAAVSVEPVIAMEPVHGMVLNGGLADDRQLLQQTNYRLKAANANSN